MLNMCMTGKDNNGHMLIKCPASVPFLQKDNYNISSNRIILGGLETDTHILTKLSKRSGALN